MTTSSTPRTGSRPGDATRFQRLVQAAAASGMTLLATQWAGGNAVYPVICRNGHRFTRHGSRLLKGNTACLQCQADEIRQHFFAVLKQKGFRCSDHAFRGLTARHAFTCGNGHAWTVEARKIVEGTGASGHCGKLVPALREPVEALDASNRCGRSPMSAAANVLVPCIWAARPDSYGNVRWGMYGSLPGNVIHRGAWCPACFRLRITKKPHLRSRYDVRG